MLIFLLVVLAVALIIALLLLWRLRRFMPLDAVIRKITAETSAVEITFILKDTDPLPEATETHFMMVQAQNEETSRHQYNIICQDGECNLNGVKTPKPQWLHPYLLWITQQFKIVKLAYSISLSFKRKSSTGHV